MEHKITITLQADSTTSMASAISTANHLVAKLEDELNRSLPSVRVEKAEITTAFERR